MQWDKYLNADINIIDTVVPLNDGVVEIRQEETTRVSEQPANTWYYRHCVIGKDYRISGKQPFIGALPAGGLPPVI